MNVILLGAGASFGSGDVEPARPPLTPELLDNLSHFAPDLWGRLPDSLAVVFRDDFERGMVELGDTRPDLLPPLQRAMAAFFFEFVPGRQNLYARLASRLGAAKAPVALVTLNYERLVQLALGAAHIRVNYGPTSPEDAAVEVCVPHGVCHLFSDGVSGVSGSVDIAGSGVETGGIAVVIDDPGEFSRRVASDAFPPVMSYFNPEKSTTSGVNLILQHRRRFEELVEAAEQVAVIGVAVRPWDSHIWGPLARTHAKLTYCSGASAASEFVDWAEANRPGRKHHALATYFGEGFDDICSSVGL